MPYTQLNTIELCTFTFITNDVESKEQVNSKQDHRAFILEFKVQMSCILSQFQELGTGRLVRVSDSSMLREGDWNHVGYLIFLIWYSILKSTLNLNLLIKTLLLRYIKV